jgi:hypothetical protein
VGVPGLFQPGELARRRTSRRFPGRRSRTG